MNIRNNRRERHDNSVIMMLISAGSGYFPREFRGTNIVSSNLEWRTDGLDILSAQVGLAFFYDVGAAADDVDALSFHHGTGVGIRFLLPQFNRVVLRCDWGIPVGAGRDIFPGTLIFTFGQAFPIPNAAGGGSPFYEE